MKIHKYTLAVSNSGDNLLGEYVIQMPKGAVPLAVGVQFNERLVLWAKVDDRAPMIVHKFMGVPTGGVAPAAMYLGVASFSDGGFIVHVFDLEEQVQ